MVCQCQCCPLPHLDDAINLPEKTNLEHKVEFTKEEKEVYNWVLEMCLPALESYMAKVKDKEDERPGGASSNTGTGLGQEALA